MQNVNQAVLDLFASFNLNPPPSFDEGHVAVSIEEMGRLDIEQHDDSLLLTLSRNVDLNNDKFAVQRAALAATHYAHNLPLPVQAGAYEDFISFSTRIVAHEATLSDLDGALRLLDHLHETTRA